MKTYPEYETTKKYRRDKVIVELEADTVCGAIIRASKTVTARSDSEEHRDTAAKAAEFGAKQDLRKAHDRVVARCLRRGTHIHGR